MKGKIARTIAVIAAGSVLSLTGAGAATASTFDGPPGKGSGTASTTAVASLIEDLRNQLVTAVDSADVSAVTSTAEKLESTLTGLLSGKRSSLPAEAEELAKLASSQNSELRAGLADARMSSVPDPLAMLNGIIQGLLDTLGSLIDSVLSAAPPLPDPGLPDPGLPDPGLPDPGLPDPGAPPAPLP